MYDYKQRITNCKLLVTFVVRVISSPQSVIRNDYQQSALFSI